MNETSKCKKLNCYLISGDLVKNTAKQKNKPPIFVKGIQTKIPHLREALKLRIILLSTCVYSKASFCFG